MVAMSPSDMAMKSLGVSWFKEEELEIGKKEEDILKTMGFQDKDFVDIKEQIKKISGESFI